MGGRGLARHLGLQIVCAPARGGRTGGANDCFLLPPQAHPPPKRPGRLEPDFS